MIPVSLADLQTLAKNAGPIAKKYWREIALAALAALLAFAVWQNTQARKELTVERAESTSLSAALTETRTELSMRETLETQALRRVSTLETKLAIAEKRIKTIEPMLLGGKIVYRTTETSDTTTEASSQEKAIMELRLQRVVEERDLARTEADSKTLQLSETRERIRTLETTTASAQHWQATLGIIAGGPASGTWVGGLGAKLGLRGLNPGILVQYPVAGGAAGNAPLNERPIMGSISLDF